MSGERPLPDVERIFTEASRNMHVAAIRFANEFHDPILTAIMRALELVPLHRVPIVSTSSHDPWIHVDQTPGPPLVIWRETGAVYEVGEGGAVGEEPVA